MNKNLGLYVHIPFCKSKCNYCDFCSFSIYDTKINSYIGALKKEIEMISKKCNNVIDTIYIGGGTPSYIDSKYIIDIMNCINESFNVSSNCEISIEVNPGTIDIVKVRDYRTIGINRCSIGLQASQDRLLKILGRIHTYKEFLETYNIMMNLGISNINVDLIFGLPNQSLDDWNHTLNNIIKIKPKHISCYSLKIEEGTRFYDIVDKLQLPDEDIERQMYSDTKSKLKKVGYNHYEISNFSLDGFESEHNKKYWNCQEYIGIGLESYSYFDNIRYHNIKDMDKYIEFINKEDFNFQVVDNVNTLKDNMSEFVFMGLRLLKGVSKTDFKNKFGKSINDVYGDIIIKFKNENLICDNEDFIYLTDKGIDLANIVMSEFV